MTMPLIELPGNEPLAPGAVDTVSAELYSQVAVAGGWEVIPQQDVDEALQKMPPVSLANLDQSASTLVDTIYRAVRHFSQGRPQADDITAIVIKVRKEGV